MIDNKPTRLSDLDEGTVNFLKNLTEEQIKDITEAAAIFHKARIVSKFIKWTLVGIISVIITVSSTWESITKIKDIFSK